MRVLMISTDKNIFDPNSSVARRMVEYGQTFGELHIVVLVSNSFGFVEGSLSDEVFVYPTNSSSRLQYIFDAIQIGKKILKNIYFGQTAITVQDPFETAFVGLSLRKKNKYPLQIQLHTDLFNKNFLDSSIFNWVRFQLSKFTLPRADGIRVVREKIKQNLYSKLNISQDKIVTLPIYVDILGAQEKPVEISLKEKYPQWQYVVLMASRLSPEKNIELGLRSFKKLISQGLNVGLVVAGEGELKKSIEHLSLELGLSERVVFEPWQADLTSYYKTADLFLNTSNFEGFGLTLLEAAAVGCPVLTTKVGIAEDFFVDGKNAFVCEVGDKDCVSNKLVTFFSNESIRNAIKVQVVEDIKKLTLTKEEYLKRQLESLEVLFPKA